MTPTTSSLPPATSPSPVSPARATLAGNLSLPASTLPPSDANPPTRKVWLIFGATGHIGRSLCKAALSHGDNVAAVGRTFENSIEQMQGWHERCLGLLCDVRIRSTVETCLHRTIERFGRVDVIVNCTGYGVIASCEDQDTSDLYSQFSTNFLGTLNIIQLSLPYFRDQAAKKNPLHSPSSAASNQQQQQPLPPQPPQPPPQPETAGRYIIFSSTSGALGVPGLGPYCATKYAVEGLIESMLYEIDAFGIKATLVEPGHMRLDEPTGLDDASAGHPTAPAPDPTAPAAAPDPAPPIKLRKYGHFLVKPPSAPYGGPTSPALHARRVVQWFSDRQPTSAIRSAQLVWQLGHCRYPPLRLLLGSYAVESVRDRLRSVIEEIEDWKGLHFGGPAGGGAGEGEGRGGAGRGAEAREEGGAGLEAEGDEDGMDGVEADGVKEEEEG